MDWHPVVAVLLRVAASLVGSYLAGGLVIAGYAPLGSESRVLISYASIFLAGVVLLWQKPRWSKSLLFRGLAFVAASVVIYNVAVVAALEAYSRYVTKSPVLLPSPDGAVATGMAVLGLLLPAAHVLLLTAPVRRAAVGMLAAYAVWFAGFSDVNALAQWGPDFVWRTLFFGLWLLPYLVGMHARLATAGSPAAASRRAPRPR